MLLSRARNGLIVFGSSRTLRQVKNEEGRRLWERVLSMLAENDHVYDGLPIRCQRHGRRCEIDLTKPEKFREYAPDGGCREPCGAILPYGHICPLLCHAYDESHCYVQCLERTYVYCPKRRLYSRTCSLKPQPCACATCVKLGRVSNKADNDLRVLQSEQASLHRMKKTVGALRFFFETIWFLLSCSLPP